MYKIHKQYDTSAVFWSLRREQFLYIKKKWYIIRIYWNIFLKSTNSKLKVFFSGSESLTKIKSVSLHSASLMSLLYYELMDNPMVLCLNDKENATKKSRNIHIVNKTTGKVKLVMFPLACLSVIVDMDKNRWLCFSQDTPTSLRSQVGVYFTQHFFHLFFLLRLYLYPSLHISPSVTLYTKFCSFYYFICFFLFLPAFPSVPISSVLLTAAANANISQCLILLCWSIYCRLNHPAKLMYLLLYRNAHFSKRYRYIRL